jgi:hypothetical protein
MPIAFRPSLLHWRKQESNPFGKGALMKKQSNRIVFRGISLAGALWLTMMLGQGAHAGRPVEFPPVDSKPVIPTKAPPRATGSGEDTGTLPDPGPSQRKTQEKSPPPPNNITLITKLIYGQTTIWKSPGGEMRQFEPWESFNNDGKGLTDEVTKRLDNGVKYEYDTAKLAKSEGFDPVTIPVLFMTGDYDFVLTESEVANLRNYVLGGGTVLFNAARGQEDFNTAVKREMARVFKEKQFVRVPLDHALFNAKYRLENMTTMVQGQARAAQPELYSMDIGTRAAVILVPSGMGSALAGLAPAAYEPRGKHLVGESAQRLSVNIMAYAMGVTSYGKFLAQEFPTYTGKTAPGDALRFAQIKYSGSWDVNPALQNSVMQGVYENTSDKNGRPMVQVDYTPAVVTLDSPTLGQYPTVFMTGHFDFKLSDSEKTGLRDYLHKGGTLVVTSAAGLKPFDKALRREIADVVGGLSDKKGGASGNPVFVPITPSDPMFAGGFKRVERVQYTAYTKTMEPNVEMPRFYGVYIDGRLAVIYSPFDLMSGVNRESNGYARGLESNDALRVLTNVVTFALAN